MAQQEAVRTSLTGSTGLTSSTSLTGAALVRLLDALTDPRMRVREARASFADGLVQWVGWADAIALSAALERPPIANPDDAAFDARAECGRVRTALTKALAREAAATYADMGYTLFRRRYATQQQSMEDSIGALRERVRAAAAARSPELARLSAVDAVMAQVLGMQERRLLGTVPGLLERHYRRLQSEHEGSEDWVALFRHDMQAVMLAELDLRLQPVEGLIEAMDN